MVQAKPSAQMLEEEREESSRGNTLVDHYSARVPPMISMGGTVGQ